MLTRLCCVFFLLASPAAALDIYEDTILTSDNAPPQGEQIFVHGSASLTLDVGSDGKGPHDVGHISLFDDSSMILNAGRVRGSVILRGDNAFTQNGGEIYQGYLKGFNSGHSTINILSAQIHGVSMQFIDDEGTQDVFVDMNKVRGGGAIGTERMHVTAIVSDPTYRIDNGYWGFHGAFSEYLEAFPGFGVYEKVIWELIDPNLPSGDSNLDGVVDLEDMNLVRNNFGRVYQTNNIGDTLPFDGTVDLEDLNRVRNNFGVTSQPVPEPASFTLLMLPSFLLLLRSIRARLPG